MNIQYTCIFMKLKKLGFQNVTFLRMELVSALMFYILRSDP